MSNEPNKTPYIALQAMATVDGHNVIFYIREYRGKLCKPFLYEGVRIQPPQQSPEWVGGDDKSLFPWGNDKSKNNTPMLASVQDYEKICAAVDAFNEHYAAKAREAIAAKAEDAKAEKAQEPRRILDVITLGSETTATECRNCLDKQVSGGWKCKRFDDPLNHAPNRGPWDWILRCPQCLAAEARYNAMRAMMGGDNASSYD